jgi:hypothetical protein
VGEEAKFEFVCREAIQSACSIQLSVCSNIPRFFETEKDTLATQPFNDEAIFYRVNIGGDFRHKRCIQN